jgi:hypothetical protein
VTSWPWDVPVSELHLQQWRKAFWEI